MSIPFFAFGLLLFILLGLVLFLRASPAGVANGLRFAGPMMLAVLGAGFLIAGRAGLGGMLLSGAVAWFGSSQMRKAQNRTPGQKSTVRSAAFEMELDHDTGALSGTVLAGPYEGRRLDELGLEPLMEMFDSLSDDEESCRLLETYLDSEFPAWREGANADMGEGHGAAPSAGPMTKEEAYEVLGLKAGAPAAEIRKAHRRLMQRLHPDMGGSSFLAARINEARDILLSRHE